MKWAKAEEGNIFTCSLTLYTHTGLYCACTDWCCRAYTMERFSIALFALHIQVVFQTSCRSKLLLVLEKEKRSVGERWKKKRTQVIEKRGYSLPLVASHANPLIFSLPILTRTKITRAMKVFTKVTSPPFLSALRADLVRYFALGARHIRRLPPKERFRLQVRNESRTFIKSRDY